MRSTLHFLTILALTFTLSVGCSGDDANFKEPDNTVNPDNIIDPKSEGYLSFESLSLNVESQAENFSDSEGDAVTKATRAQDIDTMSFIVKIIAETDDEVVYKDSYANTVALLDPLVLNAGAYNLYVMSCEAEDIASAGWDCPEYSGSKRYVVGDEKITSVGEITCTMSNVMVEVNMSIDLIDLFDPAPEDEANNLKIIIEAGGNELSFDPTLTQSGYFKAPEDESMSIYLVGMYNIASEGEAANYLQIAKGDWVQEITGVKGGQYRNISVKIDYNSTGSVQIGLTITTWTYDDEIDVDITRSTFFALMEDVIFDPDSETTAANSPVVTLDNGVDITANYIVSSQIFDTDTETYSPAYKANITPSEGATVASVGLKISSDNAYLMAELYSFGFEDDAPMTIYEDGLFVATALGDYISVRKSDDTDDVIAAIKYNGMLGLSKYTGTHTVKVVAIDNQNRGSYTTLTFEVIASADLPQIIWEGYDFNTRYEIFASEADGENPNISLQITSSDPAGIDSLVVTISSEVLSAEILATVGLVEQMDLINAEGTLKDNLILLGLPVGDEVKGQSSVEVNITSFMPLLAGLSSGNSDFKIEVGDAKGMTEKIVKVVKK